MPEIDISGKKYNNLLAIRHHHTARGRTNYWLFRCDCGKEKIINKTLVTTGKIKSCGCLRKTNHIKKHGMYGTRIYRIYKNMLSRCYKKYNTRYKNYGERGITVCKEWVDDFQKFYDWAMSNGYNETLTIDRIDVDGNYCPENCRWVTNKEQQLNKTNNHKVTYNGKSYCLMELANFYNIDFDLLWRRIRDGWDVERAIKTPRMEQFVRIKSV